MTTTDDRPKVRVTDLADEIAEMLEDPRGYLRRVRADDLADEVAAEVPGT